MNDKTELAVVAWDKEFAVSVAGALEKEKANTRFISFKAGQITLNEVPAKGNKLQVVIVGSAFENAWYPNRYDPNNIVSPECWAVAFEEADLAPDEELVGDMQGDEDGACARCPLNEWGSDPNGGRGKACKNSRRLAVVQAHQILEGLAPEVLYIRLPVTSVLNWSNYVRQIGNVIHRPVWAVITEISTVPDSKTQFKVNFSYVGLLEGPGLEVPHKLKEAFEGDNSDILYVYDKNADREVEEPAPKGKAKF